MIKLQKDFLSKMKDGLMTATACTMEKMSTGGSVDGGIRLSLLSLDVSCC